jgi:hypothetical protein
VSTITEGAWALKNPERANAAVKELMGKTADDLIELQEFLREFFIRCGGGKKAASELASVFMHTQTTNDQKRRIMEIVINIWKFVEQRRGPPADLSTASEEELMAIVRESMSAA